MPAAKKFLSAMTRRRIQKMLDLVAAQPEQYDQNHFPDNGSSGHTCQTAFCAAGFAVLANDKKRFAELMKQPTAYWRTEARYALKLPSNVDTNKVFLTVNRWPVEFNLMYNRAESFKTEKVRTRHRLKAFLAYWQNILDTDGEYIRY